MNEIQNTEFSVKVPPVICDTEFDVPAPFPNKSFHMAVVGRPGSGKTSLAINMLCESKKGHRVYYRKFDHVGVFIPKGSLASLKNNPFESLPDDDVYHSFDEAVLIDFEAKCEERRQQEPPETTLMFIDDYASELRCYGNLEKIFKRLCFNRRHLRLSIINCVQRLTAIPKAVRATFSHLLFFKATKTENEIIYKELIDVDKQKYIQLCEHCFQNKHDTIFVNLNDLDFYHNFNKIEGFIDPNEVCVS